MVAAVPKGGRRDSRALPGLVSLALYGSIETAPKSPRIQVEIVEDGTQAQVVHAIESPMPALLLSRARFLFLVSNHNWLSVDDLSSSLLAQNTRFSGFRAAIATLLSAEEGHHAIGLLALVIAALQALRRKCGCMSQLTPTTSFVENHLHATTFTHLPSGAAGSVILG